MEQTAENEVQLRLLYSHGWMRDPLMTGSRLPCKKVTTPLRSQNGQTGGGERGVAAAAVLTRLGARPSYGGVATPLQSGRDSLVSRSRLPYDPAMVKQVAENEVQLRLLNSHGWMRDPLIMGCDPHIMGSRLPCKQVTAPLRSRDGQTGGGERDAAAAALLTRLGPRPSYDGVATPL